MHPFSSPPKEPERPQPFLWKRSLQTYGIMIAIGLFICGIMHKNLHTIFAVPTEAERWQYFGLLSLLGSGIILCTQEIFLQAFPSYQNLRQHMAKLLGPMSVLQALYLALIAALAEEILFRGALQPYLGVMVTSVLLAILHINLENLFSPLMLLAFLSSFVLGSVFEHTRSIYPTLVIHLIINCNFLIKHALYSKKAAAALGDNQQKSDSKL